MKSYRVKNPGIDIEPHEVFLDKLAQAKDEEFGFEQKKFEVPLKERIALILFGIFFLLALALFSKVFYFQLLQGKILYIEAENNKGSVNMVIPPRGIIYDRNLKQLVMNSPAYDLVCDRAQFAFVYAANYSDGPFDKIKEIAEITGQETQDLAAKIQNTESSEVLVADSLSHEVLLAVEAKLNDLNGCKIQQNTIRGYTYGPIFSPVLGYTARINRQEYSANEGYSINDYIGKSGLEKYYETYLRGEPGQSKPQKPPPDTAEQGLLSDPVPGDNLVLNIDAGLQERIYNALEKSLKNIGAKKGAAVAMDPRTGAVLAMVSYPSYDNNLFAKGVSQEDYDKLQYDPDDPFLNRTIQARYPTGSTIKPFEAAAVLQEKIISPTKQINDEGYILVKNQYDPDIVYRFGGVTPHGWVDMRKALAVSSNIYFYTVGGGYGDQDGLGPTKIKQYLSLFGWNEKTGIDLPGEFSGFIPDKEWKKKTTGEMWSDGDTYNLSIGQSYLQTTPLQVAAAYCAIANGGTLYKPQIVNRIISGSGESIKVVAQFAPQVIRNNFISAENLEIVREGMRDGVSKPYGLSAMLNDLPVSVAAKTGTAEIGYKDQFNLWSSVFAPYENPEIVLVVTAENVNGLASVTLPVAHDVLNWYFSK